MTVSFFFPVQNNLISIHTLAWRVTGFVFEKDRDKNISIHTLAWRVTIF